MAAEPLSENEIAERLVDLPHWEAADDRLGRIYRFPGHLAAAAMVIHVARLQEELNHHADLALGYDQLTVAVTTHSVGGRITERDFELARRIEAIAPAHEAS